MKRTIKKVAVIGSGIMGSGIACHFANIGVEVLLLDIIPNTLTEAEEKKGLTLESKVVRNRLVNEQAEISLLLAGPGVLATITFAPLVIPLFYSGKFAAAVEPLRWICAGMMLRVIAWPMGFVVVAKGIQAIFFWTEVAATVVHIGLALLLVSYIGLIGAAIAFF